MATIDNITGFTEHGAAIGRIVVCDDAAAEELMALAANLPIKIECSVIARAKVRTAEVAGQTIEIVEEIIGKE